MSFLAFGYNLRKEDYDLIVKMVKVVTDTPVEIYDLASYEADILEKDIVFFFGENRAVTAAKQANCRLKVEFPDAVELDAAFGNEDLREMAWEKLKEVKRLLATAKEQERAADIPKIVADDLPAISSDKILQQLRVAMSKQGIESFRCITKDGREIVLTVEPQKCDAEFCMTFAELYALKLAQEVLHVKEFELVPKPGSSWTTNPWGDHKAGD